MARPWYKNPWLWGSLAAVGAGSLLIRPVRETVVDTFKRGSKLNGAAVDKRLGIVLVDPETLRLEACANMGQDIPRDIYAAARMLRSEGAAQGALRVHVALNDLASFRYADTLYELLTYSTDSSRKGYYGRQYSGPAAADDDMPEPWNAAFPNANRRRYATSQSPYEGDVMTAYQAITEHDNGVDRAQGASKFIDKSDMGAQEGSRSFASVDADWRKSGYTPFTLPEYGDDLVLYRKG